MHTQAALQFAQSSLEDTLHFELRHKEIIDRFGRNPTATPLGPRLHARRAGFFE
jgi:uncharacterized protein (DUF924 family)